MPDMFKILCVSKCEIPALLSKFEAELYKELETNLILTMKMQMIKLFRLNTKVLIPMTAYTLF